MKGVPEPIGRYENFPQTLHGVARFTYRSPRGDLQRVILGTLHQLNRETHELGDVTTLPLSKCEVKFELGIADGVTFNYLNRQETSRVQKTIVKKALSVLDFLCVACYHVSPRGRRGALKFDYHLLRFTFHGKNAELRVFHERGPRHVSPKDLLIYIKNRINEDLQRNQLKPLTLEHLQAT